VRKDKEIFRCTVQQRFLIHLFDYRTYNSKIDVPQKLTQEGIAYTINVDKKHIPRAARDLEEKGLIHIEKRHVIGKRQRMISYFLTENGIDFARELRNYFLKMQIQTRSTNNDLFKDTLEKILKKFPQYSLAQILSSISQDNIFDQKIIEGITSDLSQPSDISQSIVIYTKALSQAWADGKMTTDERNILENLRSTLCISEKMHLEIEKRILEQAKKATNPIIRNIYADALKEALKDNKISKDERAILEKIRTYIESSDSKTKKRKTK